MKEKGQKIYNVVNSVKGGCGKTTLSIWLATFLGKKVSEEDKGGTCMIDMDLQGSCMVQLLYGNTDTSSEYGYLHELVRGYNLKGKKFIRDQQIDGKKLSAVFTSPDQKHKNLFYVGARSNYAPIMECGVFRLGIKSFLESDMFKKRNFEHVIFDMPPNSDGYSDAALECVLNQKYSVVKCDEDDRVNLFMMMTLDVSHTSSTVNAIKAMYTEVNSRLPDNLFIVFNNNIVSERGENEFAVSCDTRRKLMQQQLDDVFTSEPQRKKVYFCTMNQNVKYADVCADGMGLLNSPDLGIDRCPFLKYAAYGDDGFQDLTPDVLRELMTK